MKGGIIDVDVNLEEREVEKEGRRERERERENERERGTEREWSQDNDHTCNPTTVSQSCINHSGRGTRFEYI